MTEPVAPEFFNGVDETMPFFAFSRFAVLISSAGIIEPGLTGVL